MIGVGKNVTSSGTNLFTLTGGSLLLESFDRIGVRPAEITREQTSSAIRSINLELASWANSPVDLWKVELVTFPLVQGTATYIFDESVQLVLDAYCSLVQGSNPAIDRILVSISRDEYATYSVKTQPGPPGQFWFQRDIDPQITLYPVPDGTTETYLKCYVMKRIQDVTNVGTQTLDVPYRFLDALAARVATRLAVKYAKDQYTLLKSISDMAYQEAMIEDQERVALYITPDFSGYSV